MLYIHRLTKNIDRTTKAIETSCDVIYFLTILTIFLLKYLQFLDKVIMRVRQYWEQFIVALPTELQGQIGAGHGY